VDYETQLMMRFKQGDLDAYEELVRRLHRGVIRLAFQYLRSSSESEDIAQEVFIKLYKARARWEPRASISTWVFRITVNACLNVVRSRKSARTVSLDTPTEDGDRFDEAIPEPGTVTPGELLQDDETAHAVRRAIDQLPDTQRTAILLNRFEGLSYAEVAEVLGVSEAAVKSMLFRARQALKGILERDESVG
jgi:RNA polymerase sigma-70 factor (ECF subfamily)